jgi:hypothetical protein
MTNYKITGTLGMTRGCGSLKISGVNNECAHNLGPISRVGRSDLGCQGIVVALLCDVVGNLGLILLDVDPCENKILMDIKF